MSSEITQIQENLLESLITKGDVSGLSPEDKAVYYTALCKSLGLAPASQPFSLIKFQGREVLYASRTATDQLAAIHKLNREIIDGPKIMDFGGVKLVYAVCRVTHPDGRTETATATLPLADPVNVLMKCETKAKRRATLSILGLGSFDETESEARPASVKVLVEQTETTELETENDPGDVVENLVREYLARERELEPEPDEHEDLYREFLAKCPKGTSGAAFQAEITRQRLADACGRANNANDLRAVAEALKTHVQRVKAREPRLALWGVFVNAARELDLGEGEPETWCKNHIAPILNEKSRLFRDLEKSITEKTKGYENLLDKQRDALCYPIGCSFAKRYKGGEPDYVLARTYVLAKMQWLSGQPQEDCSSRLTRICLSYSSSKTQPSTGDEKT